MDELAEEVFYANEYDDLLLIEDEDLMIEDNQDLEDE